MIPIENRVLDLIPDLAKIAPNLAPLIPNTLMVDEVLTMYQNYVVKRAPPKGFRLALEGIELESIAEQVLIRLDLKYRFTTFNITIANSNRVFKKFEILRGREFEVENDIALDRFEIHVAKKYHQLLMSAASRGLPFNLTLSDIRKLVRRKTCFYTKVPFDNAVEAHRRTIDRIDCNLGYVKGNVVACTDEANQLKEHFFEHNGFNPEIVNKIFYSYFTLMAQGKIKPRKI